MSPNFLFQYLSHLEINDNPISDWIAISNLSVLPSLSELGLRRSLLTNPSDEQNVRAHIISRLQNLSKINGIFISPKERLDLERGYISYVKNHLATLYSEFYQHNLLEPQTPTLLPNDISSVLSSLKLLHPNLDDLCAKLNEHISIDDIGHISRIENNSLKNRLVEINFQLATKISVQDIASYPHQIYDDEAQIILKPIEGSKIIKKKFQNSSSVRQLKTIISRLLSIPKSSSFEMWRQVNSREGSIYFIEIESMSRDIKYYDIQNNDLVYCYVL
ncbi:Tubulin-specific chaperone E [Smittium mucronatum]|uniref:Tubulin-specific chaperone E n=1 Tax=Smittium mucronatum TaxID=133383 RepID=A0A1R0GU84_9FUNG|nr:Tubulin-specific chaperone E [Smittium mucronatum]